MTARPDPVITPPEETRSGLWEVRTADGMILFDDPGFVLCALAPDDEDDDEGDQ